MWSSKYWLCGALLFVGATAFAQDLVRCPEKKKQGLERAEVFDGPVERRGILMPDLSTSEWDLQVEQDNAKAAKEHLHLVCHYKGEAKPVVLEIPYEATFCAVRSKKKGNSAGCRAKRTGSDHNGKGAHGHQP